MKRCIKCGIEKELNQFNKNKNTKDGLHGQCVACRKEYQKNYLKNYILPKDYISRRRQNQFKYYQTIKGKLHSYKNSAKARGYLFELNLEQFELLVKQPCHYCGEDISNGIDRKDNSIGYLLDNCLPCCSTCNKAKLTLSYEEFINWINKLIKFHK